ncbi:methyl-accepting chemotaxis protein [Bacillaceae bacterium CLA-AA-H227]|uniref:Methyl-accepting chemotaxis protein n=1 Tax=Robertmurraya yapensis (ex Hitch et al 2024) TaxID=3133160 RepID=A0ACC6S5P1_9BACI
MILLKRKGKTNVVPEPILESRNFDGQVQVAVDQLNGVVEQVKIATIELEETSTSSKNSTNTLLSHSEKTVDYTIQVSKKMETIETSAIQISNSSQEILSKAQSSQNDLDISWKSLQDLQKKFEELSQSHNQLLEQMNHLVKFSENIHAIVHTIGSISQKTKILALNAAIEAARAGEHGRGFSVVANEVGELANQTSLAVEETRENINLIQEEIQLNSQMVEKETKEVQEGTAELRNVLSYLESFKDKLGAITNMVSDSTFAVDEQTENVKEIAHLLEQITSLSIENKDFVIKVSDDMDKQHQNIHQMLSISDSLSATSSELQGVVHHEISGVSVVDSAAIEKMKLNLEPVLHSSQIQSMHELEHQTILDEVLATYTVLEAIWTNRIDGTFVYSNPKAGLVNAKARPWFIQALAGHIYVSEVYISALTKKACITLSFPIYTHEGQIVGILGADLTID